MLELLSESGVKTNPPSPKVEHFPCLITEWLFKSLQVSENGLISKPYGNNRQFIYRENPKLNLFMDKKDKCILSKTKIKPPISQDFEDRVHCTSKHTLSPGEQSGGGGGVSAVYLKPLIPKLCELCENFIRYRT